MMTAARVLLVLVPILCACGRQPDLAITNVVVYRGDGSAPFAASVIVDDGRIVAIDRDADTPARAATVIDGEGRFLVPGLWDMHTHIRSTENNELDVAKFLQYGVTSIRDVGSIDERFDAFLAAADTAAIPAIYGARMTLNGESFGPHQRVVSTGQEVAVAVSELAAAGADLIKIHRATRPDLLPELLRQAHAAGLRLTGHIPLGLHPLEACRLGMDGIEHVGSLGEALISVTPEYQADRAGAIEYLLSADARPIYECLASNGVAVTPTLVVYPAVARSRLDGAEMPPEFVAFIRSMQQITFRMYAAGVRLLVGTDTSDRSEPLKLEPGAAYHDELAMLQEAGIPATTLLTMATGDAAAWMGEADSSGTVDVGRRADLVVVDADPGEDIRNLRSIRAVIRHGRRVVGD